MHAAILSYLLHCLFLYLLNQTGLSLFSVGITHSLKAQLAFVVRLQTNEM